MTQETRDTYLATRLIGLMLRQASLDRDADDPGIRESAQAWLGSSDEGLASFLTGCQHLAQLSHDLGPSERSAVLAAIPGMASAPPESLEQVETWVAIGRGRDIGPDGVLKAVEQLASEAFPDEAPAPDPQEQEVNQMPSGGSPFGPGR